MEFMVLWFVILSAEAAMNYTWNFVTTVTADDTDETSASLSNPYHDGDKSVKWKKKVVLRDLHVQFSILCTFRNRSVFQSREGREHDKIISICSSIQISLIPG